MKKSRTLLLGWCASVAVQLMLLGCATDQAALRIGAFATGVGTCTDNVSQAFIEVEDVHSRAQTSGAIITFQTMQCDPDSIKPFLDPQEVEARMTILAGLKLYAEKLSEVMGNSQLDKFDEQTKAFGESLKKLNASDALKQHGLPHVSEKDLDIFTAAVDALGRWFIDWKRSKEVKAIITDMHPHVVRICELLGKDIGSKRTDKGLRFQVYKDFSDLIRNRSDWIWKDIKKFDAIQKRDEIAALVQLIRDRQTADRTLEGTYKVLSKLQETHQQLGKAFEDEAPNLEDRIRELVGEGKRISEYYKQLKDK